MASMLTLSVTVLLILHNVHAKIETWKSDLSSLTIGVSHEGFSSAVVDCGQEDVAFVISLEEEFHGSLYTRGSFHAKSSHCYRDATGGKDFALKFNYDGCNMKYDKESGGYSTTVIVQFDDDFIFPGDLAFNVFCRTDLPSQDIEKTVLASITLVDADPGVEGPVEGAVPHSASSTSQVATLQPPKLHQEL